MAHKDNVLSEAEATGGMWAPPWPARFPLTAGGAIQTQQQEEAERSWHNNKTWLEHQD